MKSYLLFFLGLALSNNLAVAIPGTGSSKPGTVVPLEEPTTPQERLNAEVKQDRPSPAAMRRFIDAGADAYKALVEAAKAFSVSGLNALYTLGYTPAELEKQGLGSSILAIVEHEISHPRTVYNGTSLRTIKWLLEHGANPNWKDKNGKPLLVIVVEHNFQSIGKLLAEYGADIQVFKNYRALYNQKSKALIITNVWQGKNIWDLKQKSKKREVSDAKADLGVSVAPATTASATTASVAAPASAEK